MLGELARRSPGHARHLGDVGEARLPYPRDTAEPAQQFTLALGSDSRRIVQCGAGRGLTAALSVVGDGEPVGLITQSLHEIQPLGAPLEQYWLGHVGEEYLLLLLRQTAQRYVRDTELQKNLLDSVEVSLATVDDDETWYETERCLRLLLLACGHLMRRKRSCFGVTGWRCRPALDAVLATVASWSTCSSEGRSHISWRSWASRRNLRRSISCIDA